MCADVYLIKLKTEMVIGNVNMIQQDAMYCRVNLITNAYLFSPHLIEEVAAGLHFEAVGLVDGALEDGGAHFRRFGLAVASRQANVHRVHLWHEGGASS